MDFSALHESLPALGSIILEGRAGFIARYGLLGSAFVVLALLLRRMPYALRNWGLILTSIGMLGFLSMPIVAMIFSLYLVALYVVVEYIPKGHPRTLLLVFIVSAQAFGPIYWLPLIDGYAGGAREFVAFASNLSTLRAWGYAYDRSRRAEPGRPRFADYLLYMVFFPAFINGPIVTHLEFRDRKIDWYWKDGERPKLWTALAGERVALRRFIVGMALGLVINGVMIPYRDEMNAAALANNVYAWPNAIYTYLWWYLAFTAWTEAAIGLSRLAGIDLPENFDRPHFAYGPADFWRRWNITFFVWLRRFIYLPLGGAMIRGRDGQRHLEWRNTMAVFGAVAVYHLVGGLKLLGPEWYPWTAYLPWFLWAAMSGAAVIATRAFKRPKKLGLRGIAVIVGWLLFTSVGHMTVMYPPNKPLAGLVELYQGLVWPF